MAMIRACSYSGMIDTPDSPSEYSVIQVTVKQGSVEITKELQDLELTDTSIIFSLDQTETKQFSCGETAFIQVRCYKSQYDAPGSEIWGIPVLPSLNDEVLS